MPTMIGRSAEDVDRQRLALEHFFAKDGGV
jgi:hypothetical protein